MARYNVIDTKDRQMAFQSLSVTPISPFQQSFGTPGPTKVSGDCQRDTTHEICYLAAKYLILNKPVLSVRKEQKYLVH